MTEPAAAPGTGLDRDLARLLGSDPDAMVDPYPLWARLRREAPVHAFSNAYLFSRNLSIRELINDPRAAHGAYAHGKRAAAIRAGHSPAGQKAFDEVAAFEALYLSRTDGEAHVRLRRIAQRTFTARRIGQIEALIQAATDAYVDGLAGQATADIMPFAYGLPLKIIGGMLGVPDEDLERVHAWSSKLGRNRGGAEEPALLEAHAALLEFRAYVEAMIGAPPRRPAPGGRPQPDHRPAGGQRR
ncbi:cytochrome P450 [Phenylobacterium sp. J367]|uniref:cytochrome P450 n=1 Tax=Phenylobacterium sp. J367 TaxID=2898435 RepID=UPI0021510BB5|nr:cytochrome P450 [Phenylobacterium sp. J367]MCR5879587.1 cytochrome P450 [Phenylobacterium sp. J367]